MNHANLVNVLDAGNKLMKHFGSFGLQQAFIMYDVVKELPFFHELHNQEELFGCFDDFVKLDYVGMPDEF